MTNEGPGNAAQDTEQPEPGEVTRRLGLLTTRRFRGRQWYSMAEVTAVARFADDRMSLLHGEIDRRGREAHGLVGQIEMLRYGSLPSAAPQAADPVAVELTMRAQEEANRTISDAGAESSEILAEARRQAEDIHAHAVRSTDSQAADLRHRFQELQARHEALVSAVQVAHEALSRAESRLSEQSDRLRADAQAAQKASEILLRAIQEQ
ncbi:hypothetical protein [Salinispora arenicola]|uniref:hypothetical protein n=1 Tax=Salinispora arenicola TaxID=168697 RepID=UPI000475E268|nr:hypothetical protein [Salinispora arenicola]